jgi:hypothetical protein
MPKKSTPDSDLKAEFTELRSIAKEEKALKASLAKVQDRKRRTVHDLSVKKNANIGTMADIFGVSRQALSKEIRAFANKQASKPAAKKSAAKKAPAKKVVRRRVKAS